MNKYAHGELFGIFKQAFLETTFALNKEKSTSIFLVLMSHVNLVYFKCILTNEARMIQT